MKKAAIFYYDICEQRSKRGVFNKDEQVCEVVKKKRRKQRKQKKKEETRMYTEKKKERVCGERIQREKKDNAQDGTVRRLTAKKKKLEDQTQFQQKKRKRKG